MIEGEDEIGEFNKNKRSYRQWCKVCGGHLLTRHPQWGLVDIYAATIPSFPFTPELHVNYESTVMPMKDGLPKLKDFPTELGGSGETLPECGRSALGATLGIDSAAARVCALHRTPPHGGNDIEFSNVRLSAARSVVG